MLLRKYLPAGAVSGSPCPVKQLVEFINWLEKELDVLCQAPKRNGSVDGNRDESMANHWDKHH